MTLFSNLFKKQTSETESNGSMRNRWIILKESAQLDEIVKASYSRPQLLFKHSTRCGISSHVLRSFENEYKWEERKADPYYLDLLQYRDLSNEIANRFRIFHESPQLLIIKGGEVTYHASHGAITADAIEV